ncbi:LysR family transcriptional regulator [Methyloradius palustris]|uniref:LysR family transcriptional regulator n=1 Tax=Methyloradius palustris TaxID=2778876 RepID=A0A8D5GCU4_9PROT|nr:LysR family transcriptional regulator [Methyloradius palustris]BCM25936.1 LysR family transcriptional regulator [Methyloradius palustris]
MDLSALEDFQLVATHGGFGKASRASGRSKATLSRRIADMEESLGIRLIERGNQRLELTEAGQLLLGRIEGPMHEVAEAVASARDSLATPRGRLRITAPILFSQMAFGRIAAEFLAIYPEVQIEAVAEDRVVNLIDEHFDVTIRINPSKDSELVGRCFAKDRLMLVSAPSFQMPMGQSEKPVQVSAVVMPSYREGDVWSVNHGQFTIEPKPVLRLSSFLMVRDAIAAGAGAAMLPRSIIGSLLEKGTLVSWGIADQEAELWVLHTSRRLQSPKVSAFVEFMCKQYPDGLFSI